MEVKAPHLSCHAVATLLLVVLSVIPSHGLKMLWVPTSISVNPGDNTKIPCNYESQGEEKVDITWLLYRKKEDRSENKIWSILEVYTLKDNTKDLQIKSVQTNQSGLYKCQVTANNISYSSCGTYLRVKDLPVYLFFNVAEATKNRVITAEGILLLFCAIIPGTFLLYKKYQQAEGYTHLWEAYYTPSDNADSNDYTSLTAVQLLQIQGARRTT